MTPEWNPRWPCLSNAMSLLAVLAISAWLYAPGFAGYWLGDDFGHLHQTFHWAQDGRLWKETLAKFASPADAVGHFYRPLMFVTLSADFALFGTRYWGWFATNLLLHLACIALLVGVVRRAAVRVPLDAALAGTVAALVFAVSPLLVEGVMWVSARSDLAVTALAMICVALWLAPDRRDRSGFDPRVLIPLLLLVALGFKESAAVLPLQLLLLAWAQPRSVGRAGWWTLAASAVVVAAFLFARAWWFDSAWHAYVDGSERNLWTALQSLPDWWRGAVAGAPRSALAWLLACLAAALLACPPGRETAPQWRLAVAFAGAGVGQLLATLLNLGAFAATGEGGRLFYGPIAWFALSLGMLIASNPAAATLRHRRMCRQFAMTLAGLAIVSGGIATHARVAQFASVQDELRALTAAIGRYAASRTDTTVLVIPDQRMGIVAARNGQGALVMPPLQSTGLLHVVVPTLRSEVPARIDQFAHGFGTRLAIARPQRADYPTLRALLQPAEPGRAPARACWSSERRVIVPVMDSWRPDVQAACSGIR